MVTQNWQHDHRRSNIAVIPLLVGCEPGASEGYEEMRMGLNEPVQAAIDEAIKMIDILVTQIMLTSEKLE